MGMTINGGKAVDLATFLPSPDTIIVVASKTEHAPHFVMMKTSVRCYAHGFGFYAISGESNPYGSFGEAYNALINQAVRNNYKRIIIANDDIVLRPDTLTKLVEDADELDAKGIRWQWLAARTDWVRHNEQNIRFPYGDAELLSIRYPEEEYIVPTRVVSPIFAMIRADRWQDIGDFAPISWFSDDEHCYRGAKLGYKNYVSRAYVHHVGSQTMTLETWTKAQNDAVKILATYNPEFLSYYRIPVPQSTGDCDDNRI